VGVQFRDALWSCRRARFGGVGVRDADGDLATACHLFELPPEQLGVIKDVDEKLRTTLRAEAAG